MKKIWEFLKSLAEPIAENWSAYPEAAILSTLLIVAACWLWRKRKDASTLTTGLVGIAAWFVLVACLGTIIGGLKKCYQRYEEQPIFFVLWTLLLIGIWFAVMRVDAPRRLKIRGWLVGLWVVGIFFMVPFLNQTFSLIDLLRDKNVKSTNVVTRIVTKTNTITSTITNVVTITNQMFATNAIAANTSAAP